MIILTYFQTSEDISRYKKCYLPTALRPTSFSYLDLYCVKFIAYCSALIELVPLRFIRVSFRKSAGRGGAGGAGLSIPESLPKRILISTLIQRDNFF